MSQRVLEATLSHLAWRSQSLVSPCILAARRGRMIRNPNLNFPRACLQRQHSVLCILPSALTHDCPYMCAGCNCNSVGVSA